MNPGSLPDAVELDASMTIPRNCNRVVVVKLINLGEKKLAYKIKMLEYKIKMLKQQFNSFKNSFFLQFLMGLKTTTSQKIKIGIFLGFFILLKT